MTEIDESKDTNFSGQFHSDVSSWKETPTNAQEARQDLMRRLEKNDEFSPHALRHVSPEMSFGLIAAERMMRADSKYRYMPGPPAFHNSNDSVLLGESGKWEILADMEEERCFAWRWNPDHCEAEYRIVPVTNVLRYRLHMNRPSIQQVTNDSVHEILGHATDTQLIGDLPLREMFLQLGNRSDLLREAVGDMRLSQLCDDLKALAIIPCGVYHENGESKIGTTTCRTGVNNLACAHFGDTNQPVRAVIEDALTVLALFQQISPAQLREAQKVVEKHARIMDRMDMTARREYGRAQERQQPAGRTALPIIRHELQEDQRRLGKEIETLCETLLEPLKRISGASIQTIGAWKLAPQMNGISHFFSRKIQTDRQLRKDSEFEKETIRRLLTADIRTQIVEKRGTA
ncbi:hypothetical protein HZA87_05985 [Candidatus Uhrbacteria bacterium]|nr:hypothetical protein [Candidatus Uhrbacteria bacterium]